MEIGAGGIDQQRAMISNVKVSCHVRLESFGIDGGERKQMKTRGGDSRATMGEQTGVSFDCGTSDRIVDVVVAVE